MSSVAADNSVNELFEVSGMRLRYKMKWSIPMQKFRFPEKMEDGIVLARSKSMKIKHLDDFTFWLELQTQTYYPNDSWEMKNKYIITIQQISNAICMPIEPDYAFVIYEGDVYELNRTASTYLQNKGLSVKVLSEDVTRFMYNMKRITVHCAVCINSNVRLLVNGNGDDSLESVLTQQHLITSPEIEAYVFGGEIPTFTIENAKKWVKEAEELGSSDLKALYQEYLQEQVAKETVWEIMDIAFHCGMANLHARCMDFLRHERD